MNMPTTPTTPASGSVGRDFVCEKPRRETARRNEPRIEPERREKFERALRAKSEQQEERPQEEAPEEGTPAVFCAPPSLPLARNAVAATHSPAGAVETVTTGPRAAIEAALNANAGEIVTPLGGVDPAAVWEASVREPNAIAVDVRVLRAERTTAQEAPAWTVAVGSSSVNAEVLVRHAPRLNERLRKHAVGFSHVRIEREEEDEQ